MPPRRRLETELHKVHTGILHMGTLAEEALHKAMAALAEKDTTAAQLVIDEDSVIDTAQAEIEDLVTRVIAIEQPVAEDLRILITCIKLAADIERIGDHARHIAKAVDRVSRHGIEVALPRLLRMSELGIGMLHDVLTAFMDGDTAMAEAIAARDDLIDELHRTAYREIIAYMQEDPAHIEDGTRLLLLCRFLERLGDHVTNMCEWVVYARTGHHPELND
ncbi:phosphate signaling complex protein PhoU [Spirochaeta africana]|uniref:Phosphate-specific transport system accessory protein PhoU n=1 Tax=Spirochaeta africana (strain ATCC 700263 / DSM 8902 / Z-7692) TaxID=889378 RepID=H9UGV2_SPIAZ|nr:phosphate signaling complex protein PhoU [Spirochaeta africana]AFG36745.1 phosphate transport system regulatory protein PhoU [Spirochaeta africana DSM 8902]